MCYRGVKSFIINKVVSIVPAVVVVVGHFIVGNKEVVLTHHFTYLLC